MDSQTRTNWTLFSALFVIGLLAAAQFGKLSLTLEIMRETYPHAREFVPSLVSVVGVVGLVFGVVAGGYVVRLGTGRVLLGALIIGAAMSLVQSTLPGMAVFMASRIIEGFSHLAIVVACPTLIASISSDADRPFTMGIWAAFFGLSYALTALILPALLGAGGLGFVFSAHSIAFLVVGVITALLLPKIPVSQLQVPSFAGAYRAIYTTPRLLIPGAGFVWYTALYIALIAVLPAALDLPIHVISGLPLISIFGTVSAGYIAKSIAPDRLVLIGFAITALLSVVIGVVGGNLLVLYALFLAMGIIPAGSFASLSHFNGTAIDRARATGGIAHFGNIGTTLGTPVMVLMFDATGMTGVVAMSLICCIGGILVTSGLLKRIT